MRLFIIAVTGSALAVPSFVTAQDRWPVSFEAILGGGSGYTSGLYRENASGMAAHVLVGLRVATAAGGGVAVALSRAIQGTGVHESDCIFTPSGGCVPAFPEFHITSLLTDWETRNATLRVLTGPAVASAERRSAFAWLVSIDAAAPLFGRISPATSLRVTIVPSYNGDTFGLMAFGLGIRIR